MNAKTPQSFGSRQPAQPVPASRRVVDTVRNGLVLLVVALWGSLLTHPAHAAEYFVGVDHPNASDSNDGLSPDHPFRTLGRGTQGLLPGDTLSIMAGVYREVVEIPGSGTQANPIVIRAYPGDEGNVVIRGSDVVTGWANDVGDVWSVPWDPLPLIEYPPDWHDYGEYSRRRELVFVDGDPLEQVLSQGDLASGHFWMDDAARRLRINYPEDPNSLQVEISVRTEGVIASGRSYCVFRGLRVEHVTTDLTVAAMHLGSNQRVEDCRVEHNNGNGIKLYSDSVLIRTTSRHNGRLGIALNGNNSLLDSSDTSYNSWRYGPLWEAGGMKVIGSEPTSGNRIVRHTANYNNGRGVWFDTVGSGNVVEASLFEGNVFIGLEFEAAAGPNWIINNVIIGTVAAGVGGPYDGSGICVYETLDSYIYNNTVVGVSGSGIVITGGQRGQYYSANTQVFNNIVVDSGIAGVNIAVRDLSRQEPQVGSHHFDNNLYYGNQIMIIFPKLSTQYGLEYWSLAEWQANRGEDLESLAQPPDFVDPGIGNFSLSSDSPALDAGDDLVEVPDDFLGCRRPKGEHIDIGAFEYCVEAGNPLEVFADDFESGDTSAWSSAAS